jgi:hypothetical protein
MREVVGTGIVWRREHEEGPGPLEFYTEQIHRCTLKPGDWVLVPPRVFLPTPDPKVFAVGVDDCWAILTAGESP